MSTKDQERKALEQIKKIISGLGEGSYLATAFEGTFEDAEENITYDAAYSWKQRAVRAWDEIAEWKEKANENASQALKLRDEKDAAVKDAEGYRKMYSEVCISGDALIQETTKLTANVNELKDAITAKDNEIMALKAKLFDLLYKE